MLLFFGICFILYFLKLSAGLGFWTELKLVLNIHECIGLWVDCRHDFII